MRTPQIIVVNFRGSMKPLNIVTNKCLSFFLLLSSKFDHSSEFSTSDDLLEKSARVIIRAALFCNSCNLSGRVLEQSPHTASQ